MIFCQSLYIYTKFFILKKKLGAEVVTCGCMEFFVRIETSVLIEK